MDKDYSAYKTIGEVSKILSSTSKQKKLIPAHTIRFWEKKFKQIKPKILNGNRRYYDIKNVDLLKKIFFLLKDKGMTINGVKKILNSRDSLELDETLNQSIKVSRIKSKLVKISNILKKIKQIK